MKKIMLLLIFLCLSSFVFAEEKSTVGIIPKLTAEEMQDGPILGGGVFPPLGVPCTNFTYYAQYQDAQGREPEYIRLWHNGKWHDLNLLEGNPKSGAVYVYNHVPTSGETNFYYYEASNGVGKTRASIIDSPDNGPVLFSEKLDNNEIILLDKSGKALWEFPTGKEWIEGVAISKDNNYIAAVTSFHIYLFSKESNVPLWNFCTNCNPTSTFSGNMEGVALSSDGSYLAATLQGKLYFFEKGSNQPLWTAEIESGSNGVDLSDDANVIAVGAGNRILLFDKEGNKLGEYKAPHPEYGEIQTGEFYQPDVTPDGKYVAITTGCPDRRTYLFSGAGNLLFRSEQLTYDSPVHKSAISDDGSLIAYSADHAQGEEIVFLYNNKGNKLWSFSSAEDGTARAVSLSGDGNYVAAGTSAGHIYFFSKDNNKPKWKFTSTTFFSQFGDMKLNQDGSLLAAGGTTKKVYLFSKDSNKPLWEYTANTWVTKIDFNGEYIVAGTGPREYFFEGNSISSEEIQCKEIIQPEPLMNYLGKSQGIINTGPENQNAESSCGDHICSGPSESYENCPQDCCPPTGCTDDETKDNLEENTLDNNQLIQKESEADSFCAKFDGKQQECYDHPQECNWIIKEGLCEDKESQVTTANTEKEAELQKNNQEEKSFFQKVIDWFRGWFK